MKVVLVVEAFGAGVLNAVILTSKAVLDFGGEVFVIHDTRPDTPTNVYDMFPENVKFIYFPIKRSLFLGFGWRGYMDFRHLLLKLDPDVLHMHSSFAGGLGRIAILFSGLRAKRFYSPHAFKFIGERGIGRLLYFGLEMILGLTRGSVIACSNSELLAARRVSRHCLLLENCVDVQRLPQKTQMPGRCLIGSVGRLAPQKAPDKFASLFAVLTCSHEVDGLWVGGGEERYVNMLTTAGVRHVPQLGPDKLFSMFSCIDIYIQTSLYEGMPLSVIEAQVMGIPCVVSNVDGNRDVVEHGVTGFVANSDAELLTYTKLLVEDSGLRASFGAAARNRGLIRFSYSRYRDQLHSIYLSKSYA
jgi:glycosyltransferase involved in cell wall biosynthesis